MPKDKRETYERILPAAKKEFLEKGYEKASLRRIAAAAGLTAAGLYRHFADKEALFAALVGEQAAYLEDSFGELVTSYTERPAHEQTEQMATTGAQGIRLVLDYVYDHFDAFKLLLTCADGTAYANWLHRLAELEERSTYAYLAALGTAGVAVPRLDRHLCHMITSGLFESLFEVVRHDMPRADAQKYAADLMAFYTAGWERLLGVRFG